MDSSRLAFKQEIQQMMYIAGETQDVAVETLATIEEVVRQQIFSILVAANDLANRRGSRFFTNNDIVFQFRHNHARVDRLRTFLAWKALRKTVKETDDKDMSAEDVAMESEDAVPTDENSIGRAALPVISLPWDTPSFFSEQVQADDDPLGYLNSDASLDKLRKNDERTRDMTAAKYATWSECRHASFTWRKVKRFREWSGLGTIADHKPTEDVPDILGFLVSEMVQNLTTEALKILQQELSVSPHDSVHSSTEKHGAEGFFSRTSDSRVAVEVRHIQEAFRRMQARPKRRRGFHNGSRRGLPPSVVLL